jgi:hypothetical protein
MDHKSYNWFYNEKIKDEFLIVPLSDKQKESLYPLLPLLE